MITYLLYMVAALYLGVLTSISPCPLATNVAAISYIGRKVENPRLVINAGLLYTLGRCLLYLGLAALLTTTALSIPAVSVFLQKYMHLALGPVFLLLGMFLVGLLTITSGGTMMSEKMQNRVDAMGIWGALLLGILFAISFCPTSADNSTKSDSLMLARFKIPTTSAAPFAAKRRQRSLFLMSPRARVLQRHKRARSICRSG